MFENVIKSKIFSYEIRISLWINELLLDAFKIITKHILKCYYHAYLACLKCCKLIQHQF